MALPAGHLTEQRTPCAGAAGAGEGRSAAAKAGGFSLHAGVSIRAGQRAKLERLCRYVSRSPLAQDRLTLSATGQVCYGLKTPWRDGSRHVVLDPLDFIALWRRWCPAAAASDA